MVMAEKGKTIRLRCKDIKVISRNTQGVRLVKLEEGDKVGHIAPIAAEPPVAPDLPLPEAPMMETNSPEFTLKETLLSDSTRSSPMV